MLSVRIETELTKKMEYLSKKLKLSKSQIVKEALNQYLLQIEKNETPYELGEDLFGRVSSGSSTKSTQVKTKMKEKISAKITH